MYKGEDINLIIIIINYNMIKNKLFSKVGHKIL